MALINALSKIKKDPRYMPDMEQELKEADPVLENITYHCFVSRSKGWRNGKQRKRESPKEIHLLSYAGGAQMTGHKFNQWHKFPFDVIADEIFGKQCESYELEERIKEIWGENGK